MSITPIYSRSRPGPKAVDDFAMLQRLAADNGDSFYLVDGERFRSNLSDLTAAFRAHYPRTRLAYSYKTNYTPFLCRIAAEEGCYAEVVSKTEFDIALALGVHPKDIIFNGPLKSASEISDALLAGATVNVDNMSEIDSIEALAREHQGSPLRVGLRCRFPLEATHSSRFGLSEDELPLALARLRRLPTCEVRGLHCHFSGYRDTRAFRERAERLVRLARDHFQGAPATLDVGGGLFGYLPATLARQFGAVPTFEDYASAVAGTVAESFTGADAPELILEPGAAVVADTMSFVTRVGALKRINGRNVAITSGSIQNVKADANSFRLNLTVVSDPSAQAVTVDGPTEIAGYTCMENDILYRDYRGQLRIGDFIVISNVGAYTTVFKPQFIRPAPAILAWVPEISAHKVIRRAEDVRDFLATYLLE